MDLPRRQCRRNMSERRRPGLRTWSQMRACWTTQRSTWRGCVRYVWKSLVRSKEGMLSTVSRPNCIQGTDKKCRQLTGSKSDDGREIALGPCSHLHHRECLLSWLKEPGHDFCPDCRQRMWDPKLFAIVKASLIGVQGVHPGPA